MELRNDPRVTLYERTNARLLTPDMLPLHPTVTVMDVSFISIRLILPVAAQLMGEEGVFYTLIKPQFEAGRDRIGKKGVIHDPKVHEDVLREIVEFAPSIGWQVQQLDYSPIKGPEGNIEFLGKITVRTQETEPVTPEIIHELDEKGASGAKGFFTQVIRFPSFTCAICVRILIWNGIKISVYACMNIHLVL